MGLLAPLFLAGLAALAVPIVLHLFRREVAPQVPFTAVRFLERRTIERQERRRIQDPWLLLLRLLALAMLAFAFARPYLRADLPPTPPVILAVDTSYSMGAPGRMDAARRAAEEALGQVTASTPVALVAFADRAELRVEPTTDHGAVHAAFSGLEAGFGATRFAAPLEVARGLLDRRPGRVIVITDLQARGWMRGTTSLPDNVTLDVVPVGARVDNVLVRELSVTREGARVVVSNAGQSPATVPLTLERVDDGGRREQTVSLDPGVSREIEFAGPLADGAWVARVAHEGGLPADNARHAVLRAEAATTIQVLVGQDGERGRGFFIERAFDALGTTAGQGYAVSGADGPSAFAIDALRAADLVFWLSATGIDRRTLPVLEQLVRDGGRLFVACGPGLDPRVADVVTRPFGITLAEPRDSTPPGGLVTPDPRHPLIAALGDARIDLARTAVTRACRMATSGAAQVLARFDDGHAALAEVRVGRGHLLVLATDLERQWNNLPVQPAFLPLMAETARHLLGESRATRLSVAAVEDVRYRRPGVWPIGPRGQLVAVDVDLSESDQAPITPDEFRQAVARPPSDTSAVARLEATRLERTQSLWRYGIALLALTMMVEGLVARRPRRATEVPS